MIQGFENYTASLTDELQESEDERIIKAVEHILYENYTDAAVIEGVEIAEIVTWLEKRKEQKPAEYLDLDNASQDYVYNHFCQGADFTPDYIKGLMEDAFIDGANWQKEQREVTPETCLKGIFDFDDISQLELAVDCYKEKKGRAYPVTVKHQHKVLMKLYDLIGIDREALDQDEEDETD